MSAKPDPAAFTTPVIDATPDPQVAYLMQRVTTCNAVVDSVVVTVALIAIALLIAVLVLNKGSRK